MKTNPSAIIATGLTLASATAAVAHPGDHTHLAWPQAAAHVAASPGHLPVLLLAGAALAATLSWRLSRAAARIRR